MNITTKMIGSEARKNAQTWLVHMAGKPQSWYAMRASKSAATRLANELNKGQPGRYEVSPAPWGDNPARKPATRKVARNPATPGRIKFVCVAPLDYSGLTFGLDERTPVTLKFSPKELSERVAYKCYKLPDSVVKSDDFQNFAYHNKILYMSIAQLKMLIKGYTK